MKTTKTELPEAYRIGWVPFIHVNIWLDSRPLIPRPETEYWVDLAIKDIKASGIENPKVLDLCAGSGAIGVAVLKDLPEATVDFVELEPRHHSNILKNVRMNGIAEKRARIFGGDLFENIADRYDFILSNPPYLDYSLNRVEESVLEHEPELALNGGRQGLEIIEKILNKAGEHLAPGGRLYLEHEPEQAAALGQNRLYQATYEDQHGRKRFSVLALPR